ncbi:MAG: M42 family metallopeptidase [Ruminococcaceae bacterium]|nr:M42 family metallopeptidase [Oscillospiraceae bacterium]
MFLKKLCETHGVSGDEAQIRQIILDNIKPYADEITIDIMGNMIALKKGSDHSKKVILAAHMDEVGLIITSVTDAGFLKFQFVGGIDARVLVGKRVCVGKNNIPGVIALKAIHLQTKAERENAVTEKSLYIDIGAKNKADALNVVALGDYAAFDTEFTELGNGFYKAKALDDRCGCAILAELIKNECVYDTYFCFTVQEEVGCRGAYVCANRIGADAALIIEATTCGDVSGAPEHLLVTTPHNGAAFSVLDRGSYSDIELTKKLYSLSEKNNIKIQYKRTTMGGNDARAIQSSLGGVKTCAVSVPCRYLHSPVSTISKYDYEAAKEVARLFITNTKELI